MGQRTVLVRTSSDVGFRERMILARELQQRRASLLVGRVFSALFLLFVFMSVAMTKLAVAGIPIRAVAGVLLVALMAVAKPEAFNRAIRRHGSTLLLILAFAVLGAAVSAMFGDKVSIFGRQLLEVHLQAVVNLTLAATVFEICGPKSLLKAFLVVVGLSALFAVLQAMGVQPAWQLRVLIGGAEYVGNDRAVGLSLTKISLASQICLAFAMIYMYRAYTKFSRPDKVIDPVIVAAVVAFIAAAAAGGNRSPLLGMAMFILLYATARLGPVALVLGCLAAALVPFVPEILAQAQGTNARIFDMDDKSATGRWPLLVYGWKLFMARPIGYGFGFDPTLYWSHYWTQISDLKGANVIRAFPLHNYPLTMLNRYGFGIIFLVPFVVRLIWPHRGVLLGFVPYMCHILFHNDGPLDTDFMIWFLIALSSMNIAASPQSRRPQDAGLTRRRAAHQP